MQGRDDAHHRGDENQDQDVHPVPLPLLGPLGVDHELLHLRACELRQAVGHERAAHRGDEDAERQLQRPRCGGDLLEHVEEASDGRVEDHGHGARPSDRALDAREVVEAVVVHHERPHAALTGEVEPLPHIRLRHLPADEEREVATYGDGRPLPSYGEPGRVRQDRRREPDDQGRLREEPL